MSPPILRLAIPSPLRRLFDYYPPPGTDTASLQPGVRVRVPFGPREVIGILVEITAHSDLDSQRIRAARELIDTRPLLPPALFELCLWSARYYHDSVGEVFSVALPARLRQGDTAEREEQRLWQIVPGTPLDDPRLARAPRQQEALRTLAQHPHGINQNLLDNFHISRDSLRLLHDKGLVQVIRHRVALPEHHGGWLLHPELPLNEEQRRAFEAIHAGMGRFHPYLLVGVTGSGKTEIYLQLIRNVLEAGKQALVLIPEINLGPQTLQRFSHRFNAKIVLLHSNLTDRERLDAWQSAREGSAHIVIGTRSALFTPLKNPGLIIVDEEHDGSYKQQEGFRYHARDLAVMRAHLERVPLVLGSATPSLESLHNAQTGRYALLTLTRRAGGAAPPHFERLDIRSRPLDAGLSRPLIRRMGETLASGRQVMVFLNRRGFAPALLCHGCGWMAECPECDVRLTLHQRSGELRCHHCDYRTAPPTECPQCQHADLLPVGNGTERTEERLQQLFPDYPVLRIDRDSTSRKGSLEQLFAQVHSGAPCILVGTQMLAKGHHFPRVTLVAIVNADGGLFSTDFRATERMAQQIVQVAGRTGRAQEPGQVLIQTHLADHPLLVQLSHEGYLAFAQQALSERRAAGLPPFSQLALLRADASTLEQAEGFLQQAADIASPQLSSTPPLPVEVLGPIAAPMERRAGRYRAQLLIQANNRADLHRFLGAWVPQLEQVPNRQVRWSLDVDPADLF
ncbi:MAG: primosomal protein N' [Pseudomonas sp.]